ncbi:MAG: 50S ribosomal protein L18 [Gammaproteobacteria bacterium]|nr:MAG: 50S ribosomal protein L18 [Gammaproteobacteria bacterium]
MDKKAARQRRAQRARARIRTQGVERLCVHRTPRHIYAQVIGDGGGKIVAAASTLDPQVREEIKNGGNVSAATVVGRVIAERAKAAGVQKVAFDRSGFRYHGRLRALADAARENGLEF